MVEMTTRATRRLPVWADALAYWTPASPWRRAWAATRTLADHGELVARWLEGEYRYTPGHVGPADPETAALVPDLIALNRAGVVTTGSQPGATGTDSDGRWVQRAYLTGYGSDGSGSFPTTAPRISVSSRPRSCAAGSAAPSAVTSARSPTPTRRPAAGGGTC